MNSKPRIALTFRKGGENGGPYNSHKRIMESSLSDKYDFVPLFVPRARVLVTPWGMRAFVKEIKSKKPQLVQVTGLQLEGFLTMIACKLANVKTLVAIHGSSTEALDIGRFRKWRAALLEKWTVINADAVYGVSDYVSTWKVCGKAKKHFGTVYNIPTDAKEICEKVTLDLRKDLNLNQNDIVVVSTGRIIKDKGYDIFWDVIQTVGHTENIKYIIAGEGDYLKEWENDVVLKGFENEVFLLGFRDDIHNVLQAADIFMICTKHETLCISLLEAAFTALPIVATNIGGIPEIIDDASGILVNNCDIDGFANAILNLANNKNLRKNFGNTVRDKTMRKFNTERILNKLDDIYSSLT